MRLETSKPRKGTETLLAAFISSWRFFKVRNIKTPEGDGNFGVNFTTKTIYELETSKPRKGTETNFIKTIDNFNIQLETSKPRKGTETNEQYKHSSAK